MMKPETRAAIADSYAGHVESAQSVEQMWSELDSPIPEGAMRVGPGTDAVVWRTCPTHKAQA